MHITCRKHCELSGEEWTTVAEYRRTVFVDWLGWELPMERGLEQDAFDQADAVHVIARDAGRMVGYCRMLPTTAPYLLASLFPELIGENPVPNSPKVWELSRYCAADPRTRDGAGFGTDEVVGKAVLLAAIRHSAACGADSLVYCSTLSIERLARRWGVEAVRLGPPRKCDAGWIVAGQIMFTRATFAALGAAHILRPARASLNLPASSWREGRLPSAPKAACLDGRVLQPQP